MIRSDTYSALLRFIAGGSWGGRSIGSWGGGDSGVGLWGQWEPTDVGDIGMGMGDTGKVWGSGDIGVGMGTLGTHRCWGHWGRCGVLGTVGQGWGHQDRTTGTLGSHRC